MVVQASESKQVWVNTASGVYHYPGTRWYGKTKQGEFMSEAEAKAKGYRPALNGQLRLGWRRINQGRFGRWPETRL